jgi:hypothetical protein
MMIPRTVRTTMKGLTKAAEAEVVEMEAETEVEV